MLACVYAGLSLLNSATQALSATLLPKASPKSLNALHVNHVSFEGHMIQFLVPFKGIGACCLFGEVEGFLAGWVALGESGPNILPMCTIPERDSNNS